MVRRLIEKVKRGLRKLAGSSDSPAPSTPAPARGQTRDDQAHGPRRGSAPEKETRGPRETHDASLPKVHLPGHRPRHAAPREAGEEWAPSSNRRRAPAPDEAAAPRAVPEGQGARREPSDAPPRDDRRDRPRRDGPRRDGPRHDGPRQEGPRHEGPRQDGPRPDRPPREHGERQDRGPRGPREDRGPREERRPREERGPREDGPPQGGPDPRQIAADEQRIAELKAVHAAWDPASFVVEPAEGKTRFCDLDIAGEVLHAIADLGFKYCTPIQAGILPDLLKGRDGLGKAQTGTGKTCAFLCALFTRLVRTPPSGPPGAPRAVILAPTRELASQIDKEAALIGKYTPYRSVAIFGGIDYQKQRNILRDRRADIIVATPGRLIDYLRTRAVDLSNAEVLVIDEADRMLDMGFIPDVRLIVRHTPPPGQRQTFFFSATFTGDVRKLADQWTREAVKVEIEPDHVAAETVDQAVYIASEPEKFSIILNLLRIEMPERVLIFVNRRDTAERLWHELGRFNVRAEILSGAISQDKRMRTLEKFREGRLRVLVATDVAGRGLHVEGISHVINYNLPEDPEDYVHRIGRTGRAGAAGKSISFASPLDAHAIPAIEKFIGRELACTHLEDEWLALPPMPARAPDEDGPSSESRQGQGEGFDHRGSDRRRAPGGFRGGGRGRGGPPERRRGPPRHHHEGPRGDAPQGGEQRDSAPAPQPPENPAPPAT